MDVPSQEPTSLASRTFPSTKFAVPGASGAVIARQKITDPVRQARAARLILVRAPAGFGKTTAMRQIHDLLVDEGVTTAWITMDPADNDLPRFLRALAQALAPWRADESEALTETDAMDLLQSPAAPFALFLDEFEAIHSMSVLGLLRDVIARLPREGQIVIGSRMVPDLGIGRLRVRGQLLEIDAPQLRFSDEETALFLARRGLPSLPVWAVGALQSATEGWIAALHLASLALASTDDVGRFLERFSLASGPVADYLAEDVLARVPDETRDFMLRTSLLEQLEPGLCAALVPGVDSHAMLRHLHQSGLFVLPTNDGLDEYRYHSLFARFLRAQLAREHPREVEALHKAAAHWYRDAGRIRNAIDHAIEADAHSDALKIIESDGLPFLRDGSYGLLMRWFERIPAELRTASPLAHVYYVYAVLFTRGAAQALPLLTADSLRDATDLRVTAHVNALRPLLYAMLDRHEEADAPGKASLQTLPSAVPYADSVLTSCMAHVSSVLGQVRQAQQLIAAARQAPDPGSFGRMYIESSEGILDFENGRLRQATARFRLALSVISDEATLSYSASHAWAGVLYAGALYEGNRLETVDRLLNVYLPMARDVGLPDHMVISYVIRARMLFWNGDVGASSRLLTEMETYGFQRQLNRVVAVARLERARMLMRQGHGRAAWEELERADDPAVWHRVARLRLPAHELFDIGIAKARWELYFGSAARALDHFDSELKLATTQGRHYRCWKLRVLIAACQWRLGDRGRSAATMGSVLRDGSHERFVRLITDEGPLVVPPLEAFIERLNSPEASASPVLLDYAKRVLDAMPPEALPTPPTPDDVMPAPPGLVESLTQAELRALRLLAEGYSNEAMAEKLAVSESTVRTHLRNINAKLGARSRTQAVSLARRYGLIT